jgi:uncharacterized membrane protein YbhN (UPF0104 family)
MKRAVVAYPVSAVCAIAGGATVSSGLALDTDQPGWIRLSAICGLLSIVLHRRRVMAGVLDLARRVIHRIPKADQLPTQRGILIFYGLALITIGALSAAYAVLLRSLTNDAESPFVVCAFAAAWVIGFLAVPIPAGVGIREAVLVALLPDVGTAPLLAASLALRLLTIVTELVALVGNKTASRKWTGPKGEAAATPGPAHPSISRSGSGLGR